MKKERGAIVVEATISLTTFIFTIFTVLSLLNMAYVQSRIGVALQSASKELSQYSYLYYKLGAAEIVGDIEEGASGAKEQVNTAVESIGTLYNAMAGVGDDISQGRFEEVIQAGKDTQPSAEALKGLAKEIADNPKQFIAGMGFLAVDTGISELESLLGQVLGEAFMRKNLKAYNGDNPDRFLKSHGVEYGMDSLNFIGSSMMHGTANRKIQLVVTYDISVVKLLGIDYKFTIRQCAQTYAWGLGDTKIGSNKSEAVPDKTPEKTIWADLSDTNRGNTIIEKELSKYEYIMGGYVKNGAYDRNKNEVVFVNTVDPFEKSYYNKKSKLKARLKYIYENAKEYGNEEQLKLEKDGMEVDIETKKETRTKKLIIVIPENADENQVKDLMKEISAGDESIKVEIKKAYGKSSPETEPEPEPETKAETES